LARKPGLGLLLLALAPFLACGPSPSSAQGNGASSEAQSEDPDGILRASCDDVLAGPALDSSSTEGTPNFDQDLAALDLQNLPALVDLSGESDFTLSVVAYMLEVDRGAFSGALDRDLLLEDETMGRAVLGAVATADPSGQGGVDFRFLRRGLFRYYACQQGHPLTLAGFKMAHGDFHDFPQRVVESNPKGGPRRLIEDPEGGLFVAESLDGEGEIRETEIVLDGWRSDGALAFFVYDGQGQLANTSTFATTSGGEVHGASPFSCMTCHMDSDDLFRFNVVFPQMP
jgi:hypothetical protein